MILIATTFYGLQVFVSRPQFHVPTSIPCRDLVVLPFTEFSVATYFSCRDTISVASHFDSWSQLPFYVAKSFVCLLPLFTLRLKIANLFSSLSRQSILGHDQVVSFLAALSVAT